MGLLLEDLASADVISFREKREIDYLTFIEASSISFICKHQELHVSSSAYKFLYNNLELF